MLRDYENYYVTTVCNGYVSKQLTLIALRQKF